MSKVFGPLFTFLVAFLMLACGGGSMSSASGRQLRSITIAAVTDTGSVSFTATGNYSAPPMTVTPLPASWSIGSGTPISGSYQLTTQPFSFSCSSLIAANGVTAVAPVDPNAPSSGSFTGTKLIMESAPISCE
jgi:hypothetical protein